MPIQLNQRVCIDSPELPGDTVIFGGTRAMRELKGRIDSALSSDLPVLIEGESGTGKEVIARFLHLRSNRREAPFVKLNCGAVPASILENELFGSLKGSAFRSSDNGAGLVEAANCGTLFLKEIGSMSLEMQGKLLTALRDGVYLKAGSDETRVWNARIICGTNTHLEESVQSGVFRRDLFDRIRAFSLVLPPLRDRRQDIPELCEYFVQNLSRQFRRGIPHLSRETVELLKEWYWPGNLRELENWVARAVILGGDETLRFELKRRLNPMHGSSGHQARMKEDRAPAASMVTGALILKALQANRGNRRRAAEELRISYRALLFRLRSVGMTQKRRRHKRPPRTH